MLKAVVDNSLGLLHGRRAEQLGRPFRRGGNCLVQAKALQQTSLSLARGINSH